MLFNGQRIKIASINHLIVCSKRQIKSEIGTIATCVTKEFHRKMIYAKRFFFFRINDFFCIVRL